MLSADVPSVVTRIELLLRSHKAIVVAIDGRGGAGKSTLARKISEHVPEATIAEYDWFHLPKANLTGLQRYDQDRLIKELLRPFLSGERDITFPRYNWGHLAGREDGLDPTPVVIPASSVLILEGCGTLDASLCPYYQLRIWLNTPAEESLRRGIQRDIEEYKLEPSRVHNLWEKWASWEKEKIARDDRSRRADVVLSDIA